MPRPARPAAEAQRNKGVRAGSPWQVSVGRQTDGWIFALEPRTRAAIRERFPASCRVTSIFIGVDAPGELSDEPARLAAIFRRVLELLTELSSDELAELPEMRAIDPVDGALLASSAGPLSGPPRPPFDPRMPLD